MSGALSDQAQTPHRPTQDLSLRPAQPTRMMGRVCLRRQRSPVAIDASQVDRRAVQNAPPLAPPAPPPPAAGRLHQRTRPAKHQPGTGQHDAVHRRPRQRGLGGGRAGCGLGKAEKPTHRKLRSHSRRWAPSGRLCEREGARVPPPRWLRRPSPAAAARGSSRPAPRTCVTGSASSPDEQTLAQSSEQRLTAALGAVAPGIGVSESGCTTVTAADTPNPGSPAPETPLAPQRSLLSALVQPKPERSTRRCA